MQGLDIQSRVFPSRGSAGGAPPYEPILTFVGLALCLLMSDLHQSSLPWQPPAVSLSVQAPGSFISEAICSGSTIPKPFKQSLEQGKALGPLSSHVCVHTLRHTHARTCRCGVTPARWKVMTGTVRASHQLLPFPTVPKPVPGHPGGRPVCLPLFLYIPHLSVHLFV